MIKNLFRHTISTLAPIENRRRATAIAINIITGSLLILASLPSLLTIAPESSLNYVGNITTLVMGLISLTCARISYRLSATQGSVVFIFSILFISLGIPFYANGLGLQSGMIVAVIVSSIAATTLPGMLATRVGLLAIITESTVILLDLYLPDFGIGKLQSVFINPFLIVIILIFGYFALRQFNTYAFRTKLISAFVLIAFLAVTAVATSLNTVGRGELILQAGLNVNESANQTAENIAADLSAQIQALLIAGTQFEGVAAEASNSYTGSESDILTEINLIDSKWSKAGEDDELIQNILNNSASGELREFQKISPDHVEIFITDRYGTNLAATNRTSDYYQADEEWWQSAYNSGKGSIYISQPEFDESSNTFALLMAIPIYEGGRVVGILRSTLDVTALVTLLEGEGVDQLGHAKLRLGNNEILGSDPLSEDQILVLREITGQFGEIVFDGKLNLASEKVVQTHSGNIAEQAISQLGWTVIFHQDLDIALQLVEQQKRVTITISLVVLAFAALLGYLASQQITLPIVSLTNVSSRVSQGDLNARAIISTQDEIGALANSFNLMTDQLQDTLKGLELRVAERTADLNSSRLVSEQRAFELQSISEISRIISREQKLEVLFSLITRLVSEKFNFYHVGIFLVDENRRFAVLQAANTEEGQRMLNRGHRLEVGQTGIVGNVALTGKPRIALDVEADSAFFNNPDLPETRSEMALPLNVRGESIGVLDIQSSQAGAFNENNANTLGILADQIAIAIENARLLTKTQQALDEVQSIYSQYLQKEWRAFRSKGINVGYQQTSGNGKLLEIPVNSEDMRVALRKGDIQVLDENNSNLEPSIILPIKLRGQMIGVLNIKAPDKGYEWSQDEIAMVQAVSDRLALALENARLFEETNRRAERERLVTEIAGKIRSVNDPQAMIQTAMEELRNALGASRVQIIPQTLSEKE